MKQGQRADLLRGWMKQRRKSQDGWERGWKRKEENKRGKEERKRVKAVELVPLRRYVAPTDNRITRQSGRVVAPGKFDGGDSCPKINDD